MFDRFTERARTVMSLARQASQTYQHDYIGTEHVLLGLVEEGSGVGAQVLRNLHADLKKIRVKVESIIRSGTRPVSQGQIPFTPRAKKVLELSLEAAQGLGHNYIGTEHLLLGLLREGEGIAAQVLGRLGVEYDAAREEIQELVGSGTESDATPSAVPVPELIRPDESSRAVVKLAREQAASMRHRFVGTEHLILGVAVQPGPAADLLIASGATADALRDEIRELRANGTESGGDFTPAAKAALDHARLDAKERSAAAVQPAHILLGLLGVPEGLAMTALRSLGIQPDEVRARVQTLLGGG